MWEYVNIIVCLYIKLFIRKPIFKLVDNQAKLFIHNSSNVLTHYQKIIGKNHCDKQLLTQISSQSLIRFPHQFLKNHHENNLLQITKNRECSADLIKINMYVNFLTLYLKTFSQCLNHPNMSKYRSISHFFANSIKCMAKLSQPLVPPSSRRHHSHILSIRQQDLIVQALEHPFDGLQSNFYRLERTHIDNIIRRCLKGVASPHYFSNSNILHVHLNEKIKESQEINIHELKDKNHIYDILQTIKTVTYLFSTNIFEEVSSLYEYMRPLRELFLSKFGYFCQFYQKMFSKSLCRQLDIIVKEINWLFRQAPENGDEVITELDEALATYIDQCHENSISALKQHKHKSRFSKDFFTNFCALKEIATIHEGNRDITLMAVQNSDYDMYTDLEEQFHQLFLNLPNQKIAFQQENS